MTNAAALNMNSTSVKETLATMVDPKNKILSRLQNKLNSKKKEDCVMFGYSRMHNRHNRS